MQQEVRTESLDHYGLIMGMIRKLEIVEVIDEAIPSQSESKVVSHGMAVAAMILNGLGYANKQLYLTPRFFEKKALKQLFENDRLEASHFNKETLGRTLDRLFACDVTRLFAKIAQRAMSKLGITPSTVHLDSTSFHLDGVYADQADEDEYTNDEEDQTPKAVRITQGYSRDHHPELNQVVLNMIVEHKAGLPIWMAPGDGNQIDTQAFKTIVKEHVDSLKKAYDTKIKVIADAALFTVDGIEKIKESNLLFISRVPVRLKEAKTILSEYDPTRWERLDDNYRCITHDIEYHGMKQRWVLYESMYTQTRQSTTLLKKLAKQSDEELKVIKKLIKQRFFCQADAKAALKETKDRLNVTQIVKEEMIEIPKYAKRGRPKPDAKPERIEYEWRLMLASKLEALSQTLQASGLFILATNDMNLSPKELLDEYKSQQRIERGFRFLKSPEFLADAFFLKKPERIEAMLMIMTLSLLVYSALEYTVRKRLKEQNKTFPNQLGKPVQNPTTRWIFENFHEIQIVTIESLKQIVIANLLERNIFILDLLGEAYWHYYRVKNSHTLKIENGGAQ